MARYLEFPVGGSPLWMADGWRRISAGKWVNADALRTRLLTALSLSDSQSEVPLVRISMQQTANA